MSNKKDLFREEILENKSDIIKKIGKILKEERRGKGISRLELASSLNISENYVGYIEQGRYEISLLKFILIINELEINPNYILGKLQENSIDVEENGSFEDKDIIKEILMYLKK